MEGERPKGLAGQLESVRIWFAKKVARTLLGYSDDTAKYYGQLSEEYSRDRRRTIEEEAHETKGGQD